MNDQELCPRCGEPVFQEEEETYNIFLAGYISGQEHCSGLAFTGKGRYDPRGAFREKFPQEPTKADHE